ncbi:hypothetical protein [Enhygromyxa salina]|uniref:hypothetical protein n=1 Tax=Enhygromyxa salina TaxID=215803 RepID=UPI0015E5EFB1|nr:hypothetical protein [Enhygromyxa salina]
MLAREDASELVVALLQATGNGRHVLAIADALVERVRALLIEGTRGGFRRRLEEALDRALAERDSHDRTVPPGARPLFPHAEVALAPGPSEHCVFTVPPERAQDWLHEPLLLITENDIDGELVVAGARGLDREVVLAAMSRAKEWLRVNGRGGTGEIPPRLCRSHPLERLFVLIDSDRDTWEGPISKKAEEIRVLCKNEGIPCHVLRRREAENHLPLSSIHESATLQGRASRQLIRGARALERQPAEARWVTPLDTFFAEQEPESTIHRWGSTRCKRWLRGLLSELSDGKAELDVEALDHLTDLLDELERWL